MVGLFFLCLCPQFQKPKKKKERKLKKKALTEEELAALEAEAAQRGAPCVLSAARMLLLLRLLTTSARLGCAALHHEPRSGLRAPDLQPDVLCALLCPPLLAQGARHPS
jgi:hypothetical protein